MLQLKKNMSHGFYNPLKYGAYLICARGVLTKGKFYNPLKYGAYLIKKIIKCHLS